MSRNVSAPHRVATMVVVGLVAALALTACSRDPEPQITADDGSVMLLIPAGRFLMGGMAEDLEGVPGRYLLNFEAERPRHQIEISYSFYLDRHEVTNAQYGRFLEQAEAEGGTRYDHPEQPADIDHRPRHLTADLIGDELPAVGINWYDAYAYCSWAGKRLPTEAEWEYAARGPGEEYRKYPWGDEAPDADGIWWANYRPEDGADLDGYRWSAPVGSYPDGVSIYGIMDLAGNAEEWVQDWYDSAHYRLSGDATDPTGPARGQKRTIRGGSYQSAPHDIRIATRFYGKPRNKGPRIGFRCARGVD